MAYILRIDKDGGQLTSYRIENVKVTHSLIEDGNLTFGNIPSACVTFDLYGSDPSINNSPVTLYYGEKQDDDTIKYSVIGAFNVNIVSKDAVKTSYEGYDAMVYALSGTYKSSLDWSSGKMWYTTDIIKDIATQSGITYVANTDCPLSAVFSSEPKNLSYRTVIGYIAGLDGYNAIIKYTEKGVPYISMVCFNKTWKYSDDITIDDKIIYMDGFELSVDETVKIEYVKTFTDDTNYLVSGDESAGYGITTFNPYMNQDWNDDIFQMYTTLDRDICGISVKFFGFWNIELCDVVPITHNGVTYNVPVMSIEQECDGGLITTIKSYLQNVTVEYSATQTVQNTSNQIVIHKIKQDFDNLNAKSITTENLTAKVAEITTLKATDAIIMNIQAEAITTDAIKASVAQIDSLTADDAIIENISTKLLEADSGFINKLSVVSMNTDNATISDLIAKTAKINNLIYGSATGTSITTEFSNSVIAQLGSAQIKNAMIDSVSASKINTGTINTNDVTIQSSDGNMLLKGNLQQFKDKLGNVRIQIGQDTSGSFNFIVKGADGSTALFDSNGITKDGVPDGLIVDAKVSENANIKGSKLDIDSVISGINDNNSTYLKTSKIYSDVDNQTLEVLFARQEARIEGVENVAYGQIVTYNVDEAPTLNNYPSMDWVSGPYPADDLFPSDDLAFQYSNEEYRKHLGSVCYVKDSTSTYKFVIQADGSFGWSEITDRETAILNQKIADLTVTVNGINGRVSETETKISSQATTITSMQSSISQNTQNISFKVSKETYESGMSGKANKSTIISEINQSAESITINAEKLNLTGYVTFSNLSSSGQTSIDGGNITTGKIAAARIDATNLHVSSANIDGTISCDKLVGGTIAGQKFLNEFYDEYLEKTFKVLIENGSLECEYPTLNTPKLTYIDYSPLSSSSERIDYGSISLEDVTTSFSSIKTLDIATKNGAYLRLFDSRTNTMVYADGVLNCTSLYTSSINGISSKMITAIRLVTPSGKTIAKGSTQDIIIPNAYVPEGGGDSVILCPYVVNGILSIDASRSVDDAVYTLKNVDTTNAQTVYFKALKISYKSLS